MALAMTRPTKHPRTATYRVRVAIPKHLRDTAKRLYGRRAELIESLGTQDAKEARRLTPAALGRLQGMLAEVRRAADGEASPLGERDLQTLAGEHYRETIAAHGDNPGDPEMLDTVLLVMADQFEQVDDDPNVARILRLASADLSNARHALLAAGLPVDDHSVRRTATALFHATMAANEELAKRAGGDWREAADRFPVRQPSAKAAQAHSMDDLIRGWGADRGWSMDAKPMQRGLYDRVRTVERLATFLGHRDAARVTKADAARMKADCQARGLKVATIRNDLSELSAIWKWGLANGAQLPHDNPFSGILPPKPKRRMGARRPFTDAEASSILLAARKETGLLRWLPWVCCLTGSRLNEVVQSVKEDVYRLEGVDVFRVHDDGTDPQRSVKNADSRRTIPLHPALVAEGFLAYVAGLPNGSPLFPDVMPDALFGSRAGPAGKAVSKWLKRTVGIDDATLSPNHSWRHWFIDACRVARMHPETRSALTGHSARLDESSGYEHGAGSFVQLLAEAVATVRLPEGLP